MANVDGGEERRQHRLAQLRSDGMSKDDAEAYVHGITTYGVLGMTPYNMALGIAMAPPPLPNDDKKLKPPPTPNWGHVDDPFGPGYDHERARNTVNATGPDPTILHTLVSKVELGDSEPAEVRGRRNHQSLYQGDTSQVLRRELAHSILDDYLEHGDKGLEYLPDLTSIRSVRSIFSSLGSALGKIPKRTSPLELPTKAALNDRLHELAQTQMCEQEQERPPAAFDDLRADVDKRLTAMDRRIALVDHKQNMRGEASRKQ